MPNQAPPDQVQTYLQSLPTDNDTRAKLWDVYHGDPGQFQSGLQGINIPQSAKADLWDSRFSGAQLKPFSAQQPSIPPQVGPAPPSQPEPGTRFVQSFAANVGAPPKASDILTGPLYAVEHPIDAASLLGSGIADSMRQTIAAGRARMAAGQTVAGAAETAAGYIPVMGPMFSQAGEQFASGDIAGGIGSTAGIAASMLMGHMAPEAHVLPPGATFERDLAVPRENLRQVSDAQQQIHAAIQQAQAGSAPNIPQPNSEVEQSKALATIAPRPKLGGGTSAVTLVTGEAPPINASQLLQSHTGEIQRMQSVLDSPTASIEEKDYATKAIQASNDLREQGKTVAAPPIVPESALDKDLESLQPRQQQVAKAVEQAHQSTPTAPPPVIPGRDGTPLLPTPLPSPMFTTESLMDSFNKLNAFRSQLDYTKTFEERADVLNQRQQALNQMTAGLKSRLQTASPEELQNFRDTIAQSADRDDAFNKSITTITDQDVRNQATRDNIAQLKKVGYTKEITAAPGVEGAVMQKAETAPGSRRILAELTGQVPQWNRDDLYIKEKPDAIAQPKWDQLISNWRNQRDAMEMGLKRDIGLVGDTGANIEDTDIPARLKQFDEHERAFGFYARRDAQGNFIRDENGKLIRGQSEAGRRPNQPIQLGKFGEPQSGGPLEGWTLEKAKAAYGKYVRQIPQTDDFRQLANQYKESADLKRSLLSSVDRELQNRTAAQRQGERGAVGAQGLYIAPDDVNADRLYRRAKAAGLETFHVTLKTPSGNHGFLSEDGKTWVAAGSARNQLTHSDVAERLFPQFSTGATDMRDEARSQLQNANVIRKWNSRDYEATNLTDTQVSTIENDMIRHGSYGQNVRIDAKNAAGKTVGLELEAGWGDRYNSLAKALEAAKAQQGFHSQPPKMGQAAGKISSVGVTGSIAGGMAGGAAIGGAVGGPVGAGIGAGIGALVGGTLHAVSPLLLDTRPIRTTFRLMAPIVKAAGFDLHNWVDPKTYHSVIPEIREEQIQNLNGREQTIMHRISMIPGNFYNFVNKGAFINDRPPIMQKFLMNLAGDPRGEAFRNAKGQFSLDESPYAAYRDGVAGIRQAWNSATGMTAEIQRDARRSGVYDQATDVLNLKGYQRTYQNLIDRAQGLRNQIQSDTQNLAGSISAADQVKLQERIEQNTKDVNALTKQMTSGKVVPGGLQLQDIHAKLQEVQQSMSPQQWDKVQDITKRVYAMNRKTLDLVADVKNGFKNGLIPQDLYNEFVSRGDEYIPMRRILEQAMDDAGRMKNGKQSPLYLNKQQVIKEMEGSELTNKDPWFASSAANAEAIREHLRNRTLGVFLDAAQKDPDIQDYFRPMKTNEIPKSGEIKIGHYESGVKKDYAVPEWLGHTLDSTSFMQSQVATNIALRAVNKFFKAGFTVMNPAWALTVQNINVAARSLLFAEGPIDPKKFATTAAQAVQGVWTHNATWREFASHGLAQNEFMHYMYPEDTVGPKNVGWAGPMNSLVMHPFQTTRQLVGMPAEMMEMNHYLRERQSGLSPQAAAQRTREFGPLPDYAEMSRESNSPLFMFMNANWAHIKSDLAVLGNEKFRGRLKLAAIATTVPTLYLATQNIQKKDADGNPLWPKVPTTIKERNWVKLDGNVDSDGSPTGWMFPKPDFVRTYFNPMEDMMYKALGEQQHQATDTFRQILANGISNFIPTHPQFDTTKMTSPIATAKEIGSDLGNSALSQLTPGIKAPEEYYRGIETQFGEQRPIIPQSQQKFTPEYQGMGQPSITPAEMKAGQLTGQSPYKMHYLAQQVPALRMAESAASPLLASQYPPSQGSQTHRGILYGPMGGDSRELALQKDFYDRANAVKQISATADMLIRSGNPTANKYLLDHREDIFRGSLANQMEQRIQTIDGMMTQIQNDPQIPQIKKDEQLRSLKDLRMKFYQTASNMLQPSGQQAAESTGTTAGATAH